VSNKKQQSHDATAQTSKSKTVQKSEAKDTSLLKKALVTIKDLKDADANDVELEKKGLDMLKKLMEADKKVLEKEKAATDDANAKETAKFTAALNADSANMKRLADEKAASDAKAKTGKKQDAQFHVSAKDVKEISSNKVEAKKGEGDMMKDLFTMMADDLVKKIADEVAEKKDEAAPCSDMWVGKMAHRCQIIKGAHRCQEPDVDKYCAQTCGYCGVPAPPKCSQTTYGCCWDKETVKNDKAGSNCKRCKNEYKYVCKRFKMECPNLNTAGEFMRKNCPVTCKVCAGGCRDDPGKAFYCPFWKKDLNWCRARPEVMRHFCPVTCGLC